MNTPAQVPDRVWAIGCNVAFKRDPDGRWSPDIETRPSHHFLQQLIRQGLLAREVSVDFEDLSDGADLVLVPMDADLEVEVSDDESADQSPHRSPAPAAIAGGILISAAGSAVWDAVKAGGQAIVNGSSSPGVYNPPSSPRPPIRPGGGPHTAV